MGQYLLYTVVRVFPAYCSGVCEPFTKTAMPDIPDNRMQENLMIDTKVVKDRIRKPVKPVYEKRGLIHLPDLLRGVVPADRLKERVRGPDHPVDEQGEFLRQSRKNCWVKTGQNHGA